MQSEEAAWSAPTYGTPAISSRPWSRPSSPNGPCRIGRTTSTAAERGRDLAGRGRNRQLWTFRLWRRPLAEDLRDVAGRERPVPVAIDLDRDDVVASGVERVDHRACRRDRDRMLGRASAHQHRDAPAVGHGVAGGVASPWSPWSPGVVVTGLVSTVVVTGGGSGAVYRPTVIVTVVPGLADGRPRASGRARRCPETDPAPRSCRQRP